MKSSWMDISVPIRDKMVHWPGDPAVRVRKVSDLAKGDHATVSHLSLGSHTGTHMDAPSHFIRSKKSIDTMPLDALAGPCRVLEIKSRESIQVPELQAHRIRAGERILFKTDNSRSKWSGKPFLKNFLYISVDAGKYLAKKKIRAVGVDYLSVGGFYGGGAEIHRVLLSAGIWIVEGLDLSGIRQGAYEILCLPLRIFQGDGAPARAILRKI